MPILAFLQRRHPNSESAADVFEHRSNSVSQTHHRPAIERTRFSPPLVLIRIKFGLQHAAKTRLFANRKIHPEKLTQ
jgi:hypothetical protein